MPKVSVILPVYNTAPYVEEAIGSILQQTLKEIEVLIIDDGSTDESPEILRRLQQTDSRIRIYRQTNQGPSGSRNKGLQQATGEFIYFMDSDDLLEKETFARCYEKCIQEQLDFVFFDASPLPTQNHFHQPEYIHHFSADQNLSKGIDWLKEQIFTHTYRVPVWLNFIRTDYLQQIGLSFYPGIIHEDELFTFNLYLHANRVGYLPYRFFKHRLRKNSIMTQKFSWRNVVSYRITAEQLFPYTLHPSSEIRSLTRTYLRSMLNAVVWKSHVLPFGQKLKLLRQYARKGLLRYISCKQIAVMFLKK